MGHSVFMVLVVPLRGVDIEEAKEFLERWDRVAAMKVKIKKIK